MSVERFEVGKTYRSGDGVDVAVEWVPNEPDGDRQFVGFRRTKDGTPSAGRLPLADWTEVVPERHYEVVVRPAVEGDKVLWADGTASTVTRRPIGLTRSVVVREWLA